MLLLDTTIVYVVIPDVQADLEASFADLQWVIDGYALALAALLLTSGTIADRFGRKRLYSIGVIIFTIASLLCGLAQSPFTLVLARVLQGAGGSVMFATGLALLAGSFEGKERGTAFGVWGMVTGLASAIGPVAGGLISSGISWRGGLPDQCADRHPGRPDHRPAGGRGQVTVRPPAGLARLRPADRGSGHPRLRTDPRR